MQKTALSVQSLACHGKCSLTEALPIISSKKISLSVLPTVLLSTHTGGFGTPAKIQTNKFLVSTIKHFKENKIEFDGIYTGYFASPQQAEALENALPCLAKPNALILVDPVMGDNGRLFSGITEDFFARLLQLCKKADVITPNITEAYLLCGKKYKECPSLEELKGIALELNQLTGAKAVITGVEHRGKIGVLIFDGADCKLILTPKLPKNFHGTGDMLASLIFAYLLKQKNLTRAVKSACNKVSKAIKHSQKAEERDGLLFEKYL